MGKACAEVSFLSTPSARRATREVLPPRQGRQISIHALREEGDGQTHQRTERQQHFYPRPPRGGRHSLPISRGRGKLFLSTPSARRATSKHFKVQEFAQISIHALREEGDELADKYLQLSKHFYPRPPRGGRPNTARRPAKSEEISIHALREEGDRPRRAGKRSRNHFYPRPPRGGRLSETISGCRLRYFYPRPPRGGRREHFENMFGENDISIHALREEGDSKNREKTLCFCLIIHLPAQIAKRCL